jgi:hypothetical protein
MNRFVLVMVAAVPCTALSSAVGAQTRVDQSVVGNGGGAVQGAQHSVLGTIGQPSSGLLTGSSQAEIGFWYLPSSAVSDVDEETTSHPREFDFNHPVPNPSRTSAEFRLAVPRRCRVSVRLFDPRGRAIRILLDRTMEPGVYRAALDVSGLPCGIYFCRMEADCFTRTRSLVLLR